MIYLDHSATTPTDKRVMAKMKPFFSAKYGNPSSSHSLGQEAQRAMEESRQIVAQFLNCQPAEIIFTSGGTEANNLAVNQAGHLITSQIEHHSILSARPKLRKDGQVTYLKPDKRGLIGPESVQKAIRPETKLISIIYGNNETGAIQPIREIGQLIERENRKRNRSKRIFFHSDAVQAIGHLNCDVKYLHLHLLSLSAHKFYGPKGVGVLYSPSDIPLSPIINGGEQEAGRRAGTENLPAIVGLGEAIKLVREEGPKDSQKIAKLRDYFEEKLEAKIPNIKINSKEIDRLPGSSNITFYQAEGESILLALDLKGIAVSTGSACASHSLKPSHVLTAMDLPPQATQSTIRFSLGRDNTKREIDQTVAELIKIIKKLRKISPK
jgi:cysteine desulfurase